MTRSLPGLDLDRFEAWLGATHPELLRGAPLEARLITGGLSNLSYAVSDAASVDLHAKYGGAMYVGFTGGTGGSYADQRITGFSVLAVPEPATYAMLLGGLGLVGFASRRKRR